LNWGKEPAEEGKATQDSSVSFVSSLNAHNAVKTPEYNNNESFKDMPRLTTDKTTADIRFQRTDKTDKTPETLNGIRVHRVIWQTAAAVVFQDVAGRYWRHLYAFGQTWPVIVEGGKR
jgi:hypothetical protein